MRLPGRQSLKRGAVLQSWKVASQQCRFYGWEEGFTRHFYTAFAISCPQVCPESDSNPSSSSFGPWFDIYLTKRATCAVFFMSQDSSIASDKSEVT
ncbi:hypothetical protein AVEN_269187-1 [Araneus ventricosus]|uniref:Uncharacterized protein n=1 Tax=Araneus ventricosus TaxID=182803 RepID=A0A4Y2I177_ARAVE|nr:hypothetical protein AVEN_269187-1 [Araneus ventricosus]